MDFSLTPSAAALAAFFARFDAFCALTGWPPVRLSRALFSDDNRVAQLRQTSSDTGIKRLARAEADLARLASEAGVTLPEADAAAEPVSPRRRA